MVKCQICEGLGHEAKVCPSRPMMSPATAAVKCQLCDEHGHSASQCGNSPGGGGPGTGPTTGVRGPQDDAGEESGASTCDICDAPHGVDCDDSDCGMYEDRLERNECSKRGKRRAKEPAAAAAGAGASGAGAGAGGDATKTTGIGGLTEKDILAMAPADVAKLNKKAIIGFPEAYHPWIEGVTGRREKSDRHTQFMAALRAMTTPRAGKAGMLSQVDLDVLSRDLDLLSDLLDPAVPMGERIRTFAREKGRDMLAYRDAAKLGWRTVRSAQDLYRGQAQTSKEWNRCLRQAKQEGTRQSGGRGGAGGRGGRGGRGDAGRGGRKSTAKDDDE